MITAAKAVNDLVEFLENSPLLNGVKKVSGFVYPLERPIDSEAEDIVVNTLGLGSGQLQEGLLNVNIYVPNKRVQVGTINGVKEDRNRPNMTRITELMQLGGDLLEEVWYEKGGISLTMQSMNYYPDKNYQHYINFRIIFRAINF